MVQVLGKIKTSTPNQGEVYLPRDGTRQHGAVGFPSTWNNQGVMLFAFHRKVNIGSSPVGQEARED